jgi:hypothetical protein
MKNVLHFAQVFALGALMAATIYLGCVVAPAALAALGHHNRRSPAPASIPLQKEATMTNHAVGTFEVKLVPQEPDDKAEGSTLARMSIDKQFHGDLEATSKGQMLTVVTDVKGSAGYVAIERISGSLHGRRGTFVLQHSGMLTRGAQQQSVTVVPDSGTGQLVGLVGKMTGTITDGKHFYEFDYTLPESPR